MATPNDISKELKELNSSLEHMPKNMPYSVPPGYFTGIAEDVMTHVSDNILTAKPNTPYSTPDNYFDNLPGELLAKLTKEADAKPQKSRNILFKNIRWAAAAVFVIAVGLGSYRIMTPQTLSIQQQLDEVPEQVLASYVEYNLDEFETEIIANNINTFTPDADDLNKEDIEYYLEGWQ